MPIEFRCPSCNQQLRVPDTAAGKNAKCPKCQSVVTVPAASSDAMAPPPPLTPLGGPPAPPPPLTNDPFGGFSPTPQKPADPFAGFGSPAAKPADPFGGLNTGAAKPADPFGGFSTGPKPASSNPFGDFGGGPASTNPFGGGASPNPYAAPAAVGYSATPPAGERTGLPWETQGASAGSWFETMKLCLGDASLAFGRRMRLRGGIGTPMLFNVVGALIGGIVPALVQMVPVLLARNGEVAMMAAAQAVGMFIGGVIGATIGLLIGAGVTHVCLMLWGACKEDYEATYRVLAYAQGSGQVFNVIPILGPCIGGLWILVIQIIGLAQVHRTDVWRVILAIFTPVVVCGGVILLIVLAAVGLSVR